MCQEVLEGRGELGEKSREHVGQKSHEVRKAGTKAQRDQGEARHGVRAEARVGSGVGTQLAPEPCRAAGASS